MNTREATHNYRLSQWTKLICECRSSGQTVSAWCEEHNVNPKSYYYWLRRVRAAACETLPSITSGNSTIVPIKNPIPSTRTSRIEQATTSDIILHFGSVSLEIHNGASAALIENTLRAIQNVR
ncbi:IS66 family insertion sequence element accessory protein TnpA [Lacrimispora amygdalina]|uniref:IS66 family insertion sequence element accessory protein TnpA n=1 Tax=Lacrimispora amygdalina TaxID=253257 RepID=UPI0031F8CBB5